MQKTAILFTVLFVLTLAACNQTPPEPPATGPEDAWDTRAPLLSPTSEHAVAELDGKLYVIAGNTDGGGTVAEIFEAATDRWTLTNPLPLAVNHNMAAAASGKIYSFGGQAATGTDSPFVDSVFDYDPVMGQWTSRAPLPEARSAGGTAVIDSVIYVAGGRPPRGNDSASYDPATDTWTSLPDLPSQRNHLAVAGINGKVYVAGGRLGPGSADPMTDVLEIFDPVTNEWSEGARMPVVRGGITGVVANGCLHVFGGEGNQSAPDKMFSQHDVYNPVADSWTSLPDMPVPVHGITGGGFLNGLIHLPGGARGQGGRDRTTLLQVYKPSQTCE